MKYRLSFALVVLTLFIAACGNDFDQAYYRPLLPSIPAHWQDVLGEPHWKLQWLDESASWQSWEGGPGIKPPDIHLVSEWTTPVLAWPFWPERNLLPGTMRPSGALFPWDARGDTLNLS